MCESNLMILIKLLSHKKIPHKSYHLFIIKLYFKIKFK